MRVRGDVVHEAASQQVDRELAHALAEAAQQRAGRDRAQHALVSTSLRSRSGSRWNSGQRSGWASTELEAALREPSDDALDVDAASPVGALEQDRAAGAQRQRRELRRRSARRPWPSRSPRRAAPAAAAARPSAARSAPRRAARCPPGRRRSRPGCAAWRPSSACPRRRRCAPSPALKSRFAGPSSRPGRMWQWRSITSAPERYSAVPLEDGRRPSSRGSSSRARATSSRCSSCPTRSGPTSDVLPRSPCTCAQPVMPGLHAVAVLVAVDAPLEQLHELGPLGPRADDAHLALAAR